MPLFNSAAKSFVGRTNIAGGWKALPPQVTLMFQCFNRYVFRAQKQNATDSNQQNTKHCRFLICSEFLREYSFEDVLNFLVTGNIK
jgi:hypothetical protein